MRVLVLSQYFAPEPVFKPADLGTWMRDAGHDVEVLTGLPHYPRGRLYDGYRLALWHRDRHDGLPVLRTFELPYHGTSALGRMANYASFMVSAIVGGLFVTRRDVIYVWHPPLTIGVAAWAIARLRGCPFVYDVQDIWPESALVSGMLREGRLTRLLSRLERFVYARAHHLIVVTDGARDNLVGKGVPVERISVLPPVTGGDGGSVPAPDASARARQRHALGWDGRFVLLFAGNLGAVQGLEALMLAMADLPESSRALMVLLGDGSRRHHFEGLVAERGLGHRVQFVASQPVEAMPAYLGAADVLMVTLKASPFAQLILPSKTVSCLAQAQPILMAAVGASADIVRQAGAGLVVEPEHGPQFVQAVAAFERMTPEELERLGRSGRSYYEAHLAKPMVLAMHQRVIEEAAWRAE